MIVWFTGLPASGKTTLARRVRELAIRSCILLDSDELREALGAHGYGPEDRDAFYHALGALALLLEGQGFVILIAATAARRTYRDAVRAHAAGFVEVHVHATREAREARDGKHLYSRPPPDLPGVGAPYEEPRDPDIIAEGGLDEAAVRAVLARLDDSSARSCRE